MLLMIMPGLACGPFMGASKAQAAQVVSMQGMPGCEGMGMAGQERASDGSHAFFKDCAKVDLSGTGHVLLQAPDEGGKIFFAAWAQIETPDYRFTPADSHAIRGPPPDWPRPSQTQPSLLLTTQRFRE